VNFRFPTVFERITQTRIRDLAIFSTINSSSSYRRRSTYFYCFAKERRGFSNDDRNCSSICAPCASRSQNLCSFLGHLFKREVGVNDMLAPQAMVLKMKAQIFIWFVPIVFRDSRICPTSLPLLLTRQFVGAELGFKVQKVRQKYHYWNFPAFSVH